MSLHWEKKQALSVSAPACVRSPNGGMIEETGSMKYLGGMLCGTGRPDAELAQKIGVATADFNKLRRVWCHSNVCMSKKLQYFNALVVSRLLHGLSTAWLVTAQVR